MTIETDIAARIRLNASRVGVTLWRNNSGAMKDAQGRWVRFGLGNDSKTLNAAMKSSDLIGITPAGRFVAFEVKRPDWHWDMARLDKHERAQWAFIAHVLRNGGIAGFVRSWEDAAYWLGVKI